jgi:hypothetical protein
MHWHDLEKMKVADLRVMAKEKAGLEGVSGMSKAHLLEALAKALGIEKPHKVAHGEQKTLLKQRIREVKAQRDAAAAAHDANGGRAAREQLHKLRRQLRRMATLSS